VPEFISYKTANPVRQFITSGSADETVPDESIFRAQFARALQGEADSDGDGYVTGTELGEFLQRTVVNYSYNAQHPQYGKIRNPHLDKGDFVFLIPLDQQDETTPTVEKPAETTFSLDDLAEEAEKEKAWQMKLNDMEEAFFKVNEYEKQDISTELKIKAWERFVQAFLEDNPYSTRDEELRNVAQERIHHLKSGTIPSSPPTSQPDATPSGQVMPTIPPEAVFRINKVVLKDARGKVIKPVDEIYSIKTGKTVTIIVDVEYPRDHTVTATWAARNGKVLPTTELINIYTAKKPGPDVVVIYLLDEDTGDEIEESVIMTVVP
jgi:hypothetical protein